MRKIRTPFVLIVLAGVLILAAGSAVGAGARKHTSAPGAITGIGDEQPSMFSNRAFLALHTTIARYVTPYDVVTNHSRNDLPRLRAWLAAAARAHIQPLVSFYHSDRTPTRMPSVATYTADVKRFVREFPQVTLLQPWNEVNRGYVKERGKGSFASPSATQSAQYYLALRKVCRSCTIVGLDILDSTNIRSTIHYIDGFKRAVGPRNMPSIWGLHNYSDTNRFRSAGTRAVLADTTGQLWLTETGGIVKLAGDFPFSLSRQARATRYMFSLTGLSARITRLYIFQWTGGIAAKERFDAGLSNYYGKPRPAYCVVYQHLRHTSRCPYRVASS